MNNEFKDGGFVLDNHGQIQAGYSTKEVLTYNKAKIHAKPWRHKEWDFYQIRNKQYCLQFTIGHASYVGQVGIMLFDFINKDFILNEDILLPLVFDSLNMPTTASNDHTISYDNKGMKMFFEVKNNIHYLSCSYKNFKAELELTPQSPHSLVISIPFKERVNQFYYNHKISMMSVKGFAQIGECTFDFSQSDSYGLLDWGRGVWPFSGEWYWSSIATNLDGKLFGLNLGAGFGDTSNATENIVFYDNKYYKLGYVYFEVKDEYMNQWHIYDDDGRLDLKFTPVYDRTTKAKVLWINNCTHQMFGYFNGHVILDDGTRLELKDVIDFAEHAKNNW